MPRITRYRMMWKIWASVVMALYWLSAVLGWYSGTWRSPVGQGAILPPTPVPFYYFAAITVVVVMLCGVPDIVLRRWIRREKKAVAQGKRPCLQCGYDLQGHELVGTCPHCEAPIDMVEIERYFTCL